MNNPLQVLLNKSIEDQSRKITVWITKYWETKGIYALEVERHPSPRIVVDRSKSPSQYFEKDEWFLTFQEAFIWSQKRAEKKIGSLINKIKQLQERYEIPL